MITVEDLLKAYASAYDAWLDPDAEREEPTPEYAELIRQAVSFENAKLRELVRDTFGSGHLDKSCGDCEIMDECHAEIEEWRKKGNVRWSTACLFERRIEERMRELGIEVNA